MRRRNDRKHVASWNVCRSKERECNVTECSKDDPGVAAIDAGILRKLAESDQFIPWTFQMFKRNGFFKFVDNIGVKRAAKVETESLIEAAVRGQRRLDSSFWTEDDVFDRMCITVEVHEEPTIHTVMVEKLKRWIKSHGRHPREEAKKAELRRLLFCGQAMSAFAPPLLGPFDVCVDLPTAAT